MLFQLHDCTFKKKFYKPVSIRKSNLKFCRDTSIKDTYKTPKKQISVAVSSRNRSSPSELFLGKGVLKICSKFTGKHLWRGACRGGGGREANKMHQGENCQDFLKSGGCLTLSWRSLLSYGNQPIDLESQWTGFHMIGSSFMKELNSAISVIWPKMRNLNLGVFFDNIYTSKLL